MDAPYFLNSNLDKEPSCNIFGFLMGAMGVTKDRSEEDIVEILYMLKSRSPKFAKYISNILTDIISYGDIEDYTEHLSENKHEYIDDKRNVVKTGDLTWL